MRQFSRTGQNPLWLALLVALFSLPAAAQTAMVTVHIRPQPLADALLDFAVQAGLSINESGIDFHQAASKAVDGRFTQSEALRRLLAGTGFDFEFTAPGAVQIRIARAAQTLRPHPSVIENVVVTATKRSEVAQSLPYSIAVAQGQELQDMGVESSTGLTPYIAGLTATNMGAGEDKLFVRGLTDSVLPGLSESVVGLYLDETRITDDAPDPNLQLVDIDRVEVLRGPQGSLYGAGSLSGLVRIVTRKPVFDRFESAGATSLATTAGGELSGGFDAMLNLPLARDEAALRLVGYIESKSGFVDDLNLGARNTNRTTITGGRAALGFRPDGIWTVTLDATYQETKAHDSQYYLQNLGPDNRDNFLREPHYDRIFLTGVTAAAELSGVDLVSDTSFLDRRLEARFDASQAWNTLTGFPAGPSPFDYARSIIAFTHETRLSSAAVGRWEWLTGFFLGWRAEDFASTLKGPDASGATILARMESREDHAREAALFGELTFRVTREISLIAGARAFYADHGVSAKHSGLLADGAAPFKGSSSQSGVAPKLVLSYQPSPAQTYYAQFSEGYRLGGLNVDGPPLATGEPERAFDSDSLRNFEIGSKLSLFGGDLVANSAIFYALWSNVQTDQIAPDGAFFILNAGDVDDLGAEIDLAAQPIDNLGVEAHAFWNNAKLSHRNPLLDASGEGLPGAPHSSVGLSARYDIPLGRYGTPYLGASFDYIGSSHLGFGENTPAMGNYRLLNLRLGWTRGRWQAVLYADN
ncbi:MAG TPA: TonB-dependent receptor, partial [Rhizomicrobium sp.]|nr:TonB-dependent receptor [Rhizomicrobium sp.]